MVIVTIVYRAQLSVGTLVEIIGTTEEIFGVENVWTSSKSQCYPAIMSYLIQEPPFSGGVYYVKGPNDLCYCVHESWIRFQ